MVCGVRGVGIESNHEGQTGQGSDDVSMTAARMRAKPKFGMRVLIGVMDSAPSAAERRHAMISGFDDIVGESRDSRVLIAHILRLLRARPEHRCLLPDKKRPAA